MHESSTWTREQVTQALAALQPRLSALAWGNGLTRDDLLAAIPDLPRPLYLHMPASKRFTDLRDLAHVILNEMRLVDAEADSLPVEAETMALGGPPTWGEDPLLAGTRQESGSATDTQGLDVSTDQQSDLT